MQLDLFTPRIPQVALPEVEAFVAFLKGREWTTAREIITLNPPSLKLPAKQVDAERRLRAIANASQGRVISGPGCPGYKLFDLCTPAEISQAVNRFRHQRDMMNARIASIERRYHARQTEGSVSCAS